MRVGNSGVSLDSVVHAYHQSHSTETIQDQYPALSLEEVHGAIAFYLANRTEVHEYLERREKIWQELSRRLEEDVPPVIERLPVIRANNRGSSLMM